MEEALKEINAVVMQYLDGNIDGDEGMLKITVIQSELALSKLEKEG